MKNGSKRKFIVTLWNQAQIAVWSVSLRGAKQQATRAGWHWLHVHEEVLS